MDSSSSQPNWKHFNHLKPLGTIVLWCSRGFSGTINWVPMMSRDASFCLVVSSKLFSRSDFLVVFVNARAAWNISWAWAWAGAGSPSWGAGADRKGGRIGRRPCSLVTLQKKNIYILKERFYKKRKISISWELVWHIFRLRFKLKEIWSCRHFTFDWSWQRHADQILTRGDGA